MHRQSFFRRLLCLGLCTSSSAWAPNKDIKFCDSLIDYSASNEFIEAHYGDSVLSSNKSYFAEQTKVEPVYNARQMDHALQTHGFQLLHDRKFDSAVVDWTDMASIRDIYLPYVAQNIVSVFNESVQEVIFWCPSLRTRRQATSKQDDEDPSITPRSGYVATAHIDTDVNAYESVEDLVGMILKNKVDGMQSSSVENLVNLIENQGRRFAIVNAWRNTRNQPVTSAPLAFMPARYKDPNVGFPHGEFDQSSSLWYTFPSMTNDELLLFSQYDRDSSYSSDLWHCALVDQMDEEANPRTSFDVRCFLLFRDTVPSSRDRLQARLPSRLDLNGSSEFCAEQSRRRQE